MSPQPTGPATVGDLYVMADGSRRCAPACVQPCQKPCSPCCSTDNLSFPAALAELLATMFIVLFGGGAVAYNNFLAHHHECCVGLAIGLVAVVLAFGLAYYAMTLAFNWVSGAFFNPAYVLAAMLTGRMTFLQGLIYIAAELVGAIIAGALLLLFVKHFDPTLGTPVVAAGFSTGRAVLLEGVAVMFLVLVLLITARCAQTRAAAYGITVAAMAFFAFPFTSAVFNPWVHLGIAIFSGRWHNAWVWYVGPFGGAILGALLYWLFSGLKQCRDNVKLAERAEAKMVVAAAAAILRQQMATRA